MANSNLIRNLAIAGAIGVGVVATIGTYVSAANYGNRAEQQLDAKYDDMQQTLSSGYQQLKGVAGVTKMATQDQIELFKAAVTGRYGADGSKAVFQAITEHNPVQDPQLYRKVQQVVESTQKEFQQAQTEMLDMKRSYKTELGSVWKGFWLGIAGYPKLDLKKYSIISNEGASEAFRTKKQAAPDFGR
ncbi:hypothetical protein [Acinetobacter sp.]|uniref:hypothetical protein n=1 Tax=Acinetobacter sp. TaxID=472 RepID=UPI0038902BDA